MFDKKRIDDSLRNRYFSEIMNHFEGAMQTACGVAYIPCKDDAGQERWVKITVSLPKYTNEEYGWDGHSLADKYTANLAKRVELGDLWKTEAERNAENRRKWE